MSNETDEKLTVGIFAYGSLIPNAGAEIEKSRTRIIPDVLTPYNIEFARSSGGRGNAPKLVPVASGGASVKGQIFEMDLSEAQAADVLYRREINRVGDITRTFNRAKEVRQNTVLVDRLTNLAG